MMRFSYLAAASASLVVLAACGDSSGPKIGPPASIQISTSPTASGVVKGAVGTFSVKVVDAGGQPVSAVTVSFSASGGGGISLSPTSAITDETGTARTTVTLGTLAGTAMVNASVVGVAAPASATVTTTAGPVSALVATPGTLRLFAVGDTARITSLVQDEFANSIAGATLSFTVADPTLVSVDATGLVRALRVGGTTNVIASASGRADTVAVSVFAAGSSACTGVSTPSVLAVGGLVTATGANLCLNAAAAATEYTIVAYNSWLEAAVPLMATITANGAGTPPSAFRAPAEGAALASVTPTGVTRSNNPTLDQSFHRGLLERSRALRPLFPTARDARNARLSASRRSSSGALSPSASFSTIPANVAVGDFVSLNVNANNACSAAQLRGFRVAAMGTKSIVLADTLNPTGGFSDTDYARFATRFDDLVYPLNVSAFDTPSDLDGNGRVAILFTKAVNELTTANSPSFVGGFFFARDLFPKTATNGIQACAASNEGEMFYMLVPDPTGVVNGNRRRLGFVDTITTSVIAHEFQHLINAGRRLYVNTTADDFEDSWLNEGLSHIAEELLYYKESGMQPRSRLNYADIRTNSPSTFPFWVADASSNFGRLKSYLEDPGAASPLDPSDELATRGATWSLLRYAVDRSFPSDAGVWTRMVNSTKTGLVTLRDGLQADPLPLLADWTLANYLSDLGLNSDPRFVHKSWNYRDIFSKAFRDFSSYPLKVTGLLDNVPTAVSVQGSSASYYRLSVPAGKEALLTFSSGQGAPNGSFKFTAIRTK